jgi:hypothetical protein
VKWIGKMFSHLREARDLLQPMPQEQADAH